jgi:hypothetical protein
MGGKQLGILLYWLFVAALSSLGSEAVESLAMQLPLE